MSALTRHSRGREATGRISRKVSTRAAQFGVRILENELINLQQFNEIDYPELISEIPDARFLLQWAGPKYSYPLDAAQLNETMTNTIGEKPSFRVFKAINSDTLETVGHIQLMNIDYDIGRCFLGRVLVFKGYRNKGFGKELVQEAIQIAFEQNGMNEIILGVFDFNTVAIELYNKMGFSKFQFVEGARQFQNESWNLIRMKLCKNNFCEPVAVVDSQGVARVAN